MAERRNVVVRWNGDASRAGRLRTIFIIILSVEVDGAPPIAIDGYSSTLEPQLTSLCIAVVKALAVSAAFPEDDGTANASPSTVLVMTPYSGCQPKTHTHTPGN